MNYLICLHLGFDIFTSCFPGNLHVLPIGLTLGYMDSLELHLQFEPMAPSWSLHGGKFHGTHDRTIEIASTKTM